MSEQPFNIALGGLGFGAEFIPIHQAHPNANLIAVCRRNEEEMNKVADEFGIEKVFFAWGGGTELGKEHYYRLHGGNFVVEFDNRQNGANHIHSVWRDVDNDFAEDVMRQLLLAYHVL